MNLPGRKSSKMQSAEENANATAAGRGQPNRAQNELAGSSGRGIGKLGQKAPERATVTAVIVGVVRRHDHRLHGVPGGIHRRCPPTYEPKRHRSMGAHDRSWAL